MHEHYSGPASVTVAGYRILLDTSPPLAADIYWRHAALSDRLLDEGGGYAFVAIAVSEDEHPSLVVTGRFDPAGGVGPGVLVVPETQQVFVGTGTMLSAYDRRSGSWQVTWRDGAELGFWSWDQHEDVVLMSAELELAAWNTQGEKLWTRFVEPPWSFSVRDSIVHLDVMGDMTSFPLTGPPSGPAVR